MSANSNFLSKKLDAWMRDITSMANPIILILIPFWIIGWNPYFIKLLITLLVNEVLCSLIKLFFHRTRPDGQEYKGAVEKIDAGSFPSLHTSRIVIAYMFLVNQSTEMAATISFIIIILLVGISRVTLKRHHLTDVLGGLAIGFILTFISLKYGGI